MSSEVVCIESEDEDVLLISSQNPSDVIVIDDTPRVQTNGNLSLETIELDAEPGPSSGVDCVTHSPVKRIQPTLISHEVTSPSKKREFGGEEAARVVKKRRKVAKGDFGSFKRTRIMQLSDNALDLDGKSDEEEAKAAVKKETAVSNAAVTEEKLTKEFRKLVQTCQSVDRSGDMEKLIRKKLVGYYREAPLDFVNSKSFRDVVTSVNEEIQKSPHLIYLKITRIIEELKPRRKTVLVKQENDVQNGSGGGGGEKAAVAVISTEEVERNSKKAAQIKKLNKALVQLKKRIDELDHEEVDWDEDINSAHMKVERYKKRACQIYEKLCDISGESKHAERSVRKPIKFHGTVYPEFNRTLQAFVNRTNIFPDYFDVKKCLEHCDKQYNMKLRTEEIRVIAQDAFVKVGKILQKRRKMDLYEMISYFAGTDKDPADEDPDLQDKLGQNKQHHAKISDLIDKFADEQGTNGKAETDNDDDDDDGDVKIDPSTMLEANMSVDDDNDETQQLDKSFDLFAEDGGVAEPNESVIDIVDEIESATETLPLPPPPTVSPPLPAPSKSPPLTESVNMDEAIQFMVSNSIDPFGMPDLDTAIMADFPIETE